MRKTVLAITFVIATAMVSIGEEADFKKSIDIPVSVTMDVTPNGRMVKVGFDVFSIFGHKAKATESSEETTSGGKDKGIFKKVGGYVSENPWKSALVAAVVIGGGYAAYDNNKGSSGTSSVTARDDQSDNRAAGLTLSNVTSGDDIIINFNNFSNAEPSE